MSNFITGSFWSLEKDYYDESKNSGGSYYNTYQDFISGSRNDAIVKDFIFDNPFTYVPSYGSSVSISFSNTVINYGDGYSSLSDNSLNNIDFTMRLRFENRSDVEASGIMNYIKEKTKNTESFPFQGSPRSNFSNDDSYKSLYSLYPYFVQDFLCLESSSSNKYIDNTDITLTFKNLNLSNFSIKNLLSVPSMPQEKKDIIEEYYKKDTLDIKPSYSVSFDSNTRRSHFGSIQSRDFYNSDGINNQLEVLELNYESVDDQKLLKLLSFLIGKKGRKSFKFNNVSNFDGEKSYLCDSVNHTYLYKGVHSISISLIESPL